MDKKYNQTIATIPEDEPIFVLRAQDQLAYDVIAKYREDCTFNGCSEEHVEAIDLVLQDFVVWQTKNEEKVKLPD